MLTTRGFGRLIEPFTGRVLLGSQVVERASARAAEFARCDLKRRDRVFLHDGNTIEFFVDLLATWRLGACAIPIDSRLVPSEIATLAGAARPRLSIWRERPPEATRSTLDDLDVTVIDATSEPPPWRPSAPSVSMTKRWSCSRPAPQETPKGLFTHIDRCGRGG
jgi:acyl-CoA synthetase (AMP-forming)/AMP-acid ligase II